MSATSTVSAKEVIDSFSSMGRRVRTSTINRLSLESSLKAQPRRPEQYVPRVIMRIQRSDGAGNALGGPGVVGQSHMTALRTQAQEVLAAVQEDAKAGHRPSSLAATAVYSAELILACKESRPKRLTQGEVARSVDAAEYTVREQYRNIFYPVVQTFIRNVPQAAPLTS
jgi:transcription initiation factor TFIIIB Brf1 subunit/transcription initiation factor TFIIB